MKLLKNFLSLKMSEQLKDLICDLSEENKKSISLTANNSSWIELSFLPQKLIEYGAQQFDTLFNMHPDEKHNIISKEGENMQVFRWQKSYGKTPEYDKSDEYFKTHFYMYSGLDTSKNNDVLPQLFAPFFEYIKSIDERYNQVVINWYDSDDHIAFHRDCQRNMMVDVPILVLTLTLASEESLRNFDIIPFELNPESVELLYKNVSIPSKHGMLLKMCGEFQTEFRHGIKQKLNSGKRISMSFRAFE